MNYEALLKRLWPILKPRVAALIAKLLRQKFPELGETSAVELGVLIVSIVEGLLDDPEPALVAQATQALEAHA